MAKSKSGVSKAQYVRDALSALGSDAKPSAILEHIKAAGGPDIPPTMISSYKSNMKKKGKGGRRGRAARPAGGPARGGDIFADIAAVRGLLNKHGKPGLVKLIDAIG